MKTQYNFFDSLPVVFRPMVDEFLPSSKLIDDLNQLLGNTKTCFPFPIDIYNEYEGDKCVETIIQIAAAGWTKEDCSVNLDKDTIIIKIQESEKEKAEPVKTKKYIQKQISKTNGTIKWNLSPNVDKENINVDFQNGILKINIPIKKKQDEVSVKKLF